MLCVRRRRLDGDNRRVAIPSLIHQWGVRIGTGRCSSRCAVCGSSLVSCRQYQGSLRLGSPLSRPGTLPVTQPSCPRPNQPCRPLWPSVCSTRCRSDPVCIQTGVPPARYRSWPSTGHHISSPNLPAAEIRRFEANLYAIASPLDFYPSLLDSVFPRASPVPPADSYHPHHA